MTATKKCPNCGLDNTIDRAVCENCATELTAYGKQVGMENNFERRLSKQVEDLDERPMIVNVMAAFTALLSLPLLADVVHTFRSQPKADPENVNAITTAFGALAPIFHTVVMAPLAILVVVLAYFTWTQRPWTWTANLAILGIVAVVVFVNLHLQIAAFFWFAVIGVLAYFWLLPRTKAWFALA